MPPFSRPAFVQDICAYAADQGLDDQPFETDVPGLSVLRARTTTAMQPILYEPSLCLILQGAKETYLGDERLTLAAGQAIIVSQVVPVVSRVVSASSTKPYVALVLALDLGIVRSLVDEVPATPSGSSGAGIGTGIGIGPLGAFGADEALLGAMGRLFELVAKPAERPVLAPLVVREIHFRLLMAPAGGALRALLDRGSPASRIASAVTRIKQDYAAPLSIAGLAGVAGMSASSFHAHFKAFTSKTPLQFQKDLRLLEARRLLMAGSHNVSSAAFSVGYESPTQFSREYARKFGTPPRADMVRGAG